MVQTIISQAAHKAGRGLAVAAGVGAVEGSYGGECQPAQSQLAVL